MKIIKVVVDKLPESASRCQASKRTWNQEWDMESVYCEFTSNTVLEDIRDYVTRRCPGCPLEEVRE